MKCTFVQYNGYCLKWKKMKTERKSTGGLSSLSQVFNDIEDN